jgi:DNA-binding NtrC family response regulator
MMNAQQAILNHSPKDRQLSEKISGKVLIADRNPHVRDFLKREMSAAGFHIRLAENAKEVLRCIRSDITIALLILDPNLPDTEEVSLMEKLQDQLPGLPVILHTHLPDYKKLTEMMNVASCIEKEGHSIENLKAAVTNIFNTQLP